jgi:hypothetical protein
LKKLFSLPANSDDTDTTRNIPSLPNELVMPILTSFDPEATLYDVFPPEICAKLCPLWHMLTERRLRCGLELCPMMPCKHCESTDTDNLIQELDYMEDPDGCELAFDVFYGKKAWQNFNCRLRISICFSQG